MIELEDLSAETYETHRFYRFHLFSRALVLAVSHGDLNLLERLRAYCPTGFAEAGMEEAAVLQKVDILDWLVENFAGITWNSKVADKAVRAGHLEVLQWLQEGSPDPVLVRAGAVKLAAIGGHLEVVEWLLQIPDHQAPALVHADEALGISDAEKGSDTHAEEEALEGGDDALEGEDGVLDDEDEGYDT